MPPPFFPCRFKELNSHCNHGEELKDHILLHSHSSLLWESKLLLVLCQTWELVSYNNKTIANIYGPLFSFLFLLVPCTFFLSGCPPGGASCLVLPQPSCRTQCSVALLHKANLLHETLSKRDCNKDFMWDWEIKFTSYTTEQR